MEERKEERKKRYLHKRIRERHWKREKRDLHKRVTDIERDIKWNEKKHGKGKESGAREGTILQR